ncbi:uncharacterized protein LOC102716264 [Oryza brachyantha]|uniref:uncharacterized protein LOC102716264 n=1 Tax=Oryza brachyantha TaxID=4533 RepID=UPI00077618A2|nr:uncharacterized protein LOC102716264 [Oryza brachyantha]
MHLTKFSDMMGNNAIPPGGFINYIQPNFSEQFNFVGEHSQPEEFSTPISARDNTYVSVDSGDEAPRTEKRVFWTQEEDVRMMSSWLLNSTDSTIGADRKNDQYWTDVEAFTMRLHQARMIYTSGYNDQMWIEKAHVFYIKDNEKLSLGPFVLMEVWNTVKTEAKWITYNNGLKAARKRTATKGLGTEKDEIYPEWAAFVKTIRKPQTEKHKLNAQRQDGARKDVKCAFGVLQSRFDIVNRPARLWKRNDVVNIMQACVILHNMILEDEKDLVRIPLDLNENPSATIVLPPEVQTNDNSNPCFVDVFNRNSTIRAGSTHRQLKNDLVEHIWQRYGPRGG